MSQPAKRKPQEYGEMVVENKARKTNHLYRAESLALSDERISTIVSGTLEELAALSASTERLQYDRTEAIKEQTLLYVRACADTATLPSFSGLCRALGYTTEGINRRLRENPLHPTSEWLTMAHDSFADALDDAALRGDVNPVVGIFTLKARSGWRDTISIEPVPPQTPIGEAVRAEALAEKYIDIFDGED